MHAQCVKLRFQLAELVPAHSVTLFRCGKAGVRRTLGTCEETECEARMGESYGMRGALQSVAVVVDVVEAARQGGRHAQGSSEAPD